MAWNEPGNKEPRDPWGNKRNDGPPDLDQLFKNISKNLNRLLGGKGGNTGGGIAFSVVVVLAAIFWFLSGIYIIDESERGIVLQFGKYHKTTLPGPHWLPSMIQRVEQVNVKAVRQVHGEGTMLTEDENIVDLKFSVQYNIKDPANYIFNMRNADMVVKQAASSATREVIGKNKMDYVITDGRNDIANKAKILLQEILDSYNVGIYVQLFNLNDSQPPQQVSGAFEDAIKAREDKVRYLNEAEAYRNEIIPLARGEAKRQIEEAKAYKVSVTKRSEGEADRFNKLLTEYRKAPEVTRERLYLDAVESVLSNTTKVMMDVDGGNNLLYLPLDQLIKQGNIGSPANTNHRRETSNTSPSFLNSRNTSRTRESR